MNTLSRDITAQIFTNSDAYLALRRQWSALVNSERKHELSAAHHLLYLALLGKDWRKAFTPPTNRRKVENGALTGWELFRALSKVCVPFSQEPLLAPFEGVVMPEMLQRIASLLPWREAYTHTYHPEHFAGGVFPFDAYAVPEAMLADATVKESADA